MSLTLDAKIPEGPLAEKWENYKFNLKLVNPNNRRKFTVLIVGTGLAGASAAATLWLMPQATMASASEVCSRRGFISAPQWMMVAPAGLCCLDRRQHSLPTWRSGSFASAGLCDIHLWSNIGGDGLPLKYDHQPTRAICICAAQHGEPHVQTLSTFRRVRRACLGIAQRSSTGQPACAR